MSLVSYPTLPDPKDPKDPTRPYPTRPDPTRPYQSPPNPQHSVAQSKGFIIRVAGIDATAVTEGTDAFTVATTEKPLVYIAGVAAEVGGAEGAWTVAKPEITADTCVSFVKGQSIAAVGKKWYENPTIVGRASTGTGDTAAGFNSSLAGFWFAQHNGQNGGQSYICNWVDMLEAWPNYATPASWQVASNRGSGISEKFGFVITGNVSVDNGCKFFDLATAAQLGTVTLKNADGAFTPECFWIDGNVMWVNGYAGAVGSKDKLYKFTIPASGLVDGMELTAETVVQCPKSFHGFRVFTVGSTQYFYLKVDDGNKLYVGTEAGSDSFTENLAFEIGARYTDICIVGTTAYLFQNNASMAKVDMYDVDPATGLLAATPKKTLDLGDFGMKNACNGGSIFVDASEENCLVLAAGGAYAFQYTPFAITVDDQIENGTITPSAATADAGETITLTVTADQGFKLKTIAANGGDVTLTPVTEGEEYTFTMPAAAVTVTAEFEAAGPVWPELPDEFPADADDAVKAKYADWAKTYGVKDASGLSDAFLMNVDPTATVPELKIESITVANDEATIVVSAGTADLAKVNGVLYVESSDDLTSWNETQVAIPTEITEGDWTVTVNAGKFMKAKVGFKDPTAE